MNNKASFTEDKRLIARRLLASAMEMNPADIPDDAAIGRLKNWDSLAHMRLILALEEHIGTLLTPDTVVAIGSLSDIAKALADAEISSQP